MKMPRVIRRTGLKIKKHSPELLMIGGAIGIVGAGVMACRATLKLDDVVDVANYVKEEIDNSFELGDIDEKERTREIAKNYVDTALSLVKLYGPSILLASGSLTLMFSANNILKKRAAYASASAAALQKILTDYRSRVVEKYGKEEDTRLRYGIKEEVVDVVTTDEKGKEKHQKEKINTVDGLSNYGIDNYSDFARIFAEGSTREATNDPGYNKMFLERQQAYANDKLAVQGYLFLNDVYDMLGFKKTKAGHCFGWIYDPNNEKEGNLSDSFVSFGMMELFDERKAAFFEGDEPGILLDFNCVYIEDRAFVNDI